MYLLLLQALAILKLLVHNFVIVSMLVALPRPGQFFHEKTRHSLIAMVLSMLELSITYQKERTLSIAILFGFCVFSTRDHAA